MASNHDIHHRKSIRLRGYDYSQAGLYFITICAHERLPLFGEIVDAKMRLNDADKLFTTNGEKRQKCVTLFNCMSLW